MAKHGEAWRSCRHTSWANEVQGLKTRLSSSQFLKDLHAGLSLCHFGFHPVNIKNLQTASASETSDSIIRPTMIAVAISFRTSVHKRIGLFLGATMFKQNPQLYWTKRNTSKHFITIKPPPRWLTIPPHGLPPSSPRPCSGGKLHRGR